jgi:hypothetical protein
MMPKQTPTPRPTHFRSHLIDSAAALALMVLALEMLSIFWMSDVAFQASVYGPMKYAKSSSSVQIEEPMKKAPSFTACERRAYRIPNAKRQQQVLVLCHAREKNR